MKITLVKSTYNRTQYDTAELFSIDSSKNSIDFFGRNGELEREQLPEGTDAKAILAKIFEAFDAEKENIYIFLYDEGGVKIYTDEEFKIEIEDKEVQRL